MKVDISRWTVGHCVEIGHAKAQQSLAKHVSQSYVRTDRQKDREKKILKKRKTKRVIDIKTKSQ